VQRAEDFRASGRPDDALRVLDQVIAVKPAGWLVFARRAETFAALGRTAECEADRDRAVERGGDIPFLIRLAEERSRAGRWGPAVALYDRAIARGMVPYEVWGQAAIAHLAIDDEAGYRHVCEAMRSRYPTTVSERWVAAELAAVCTLGPAGIGDDGKARSWAEHCLAGLPADREGLRHSLLRLFGGVLYRSGHGRAAIDRINEGIAAEHSEINAEEMTLLAMAYQETGDPVRARAWLAGLRADEPATHPSEFWDAQARRLLRREAQRLILDRTFPADPFAP
jgi:hypothetical protein